RIHQEQVNRRLHSMGLTDPNGKPYTVPESYVRYVVALVHGNLGDSYQYNEPVTTLLMQRLPNSILLLGAALLVALAIGIPIAIFSRFMRASMLEVLHQDYIRTARAKGLALDRVNYKHALRNAILPIITLVAIAIPQIVNGAIITEGIFSWPGTGQLAFQAVVDRDYPVILGVVMLVAALTVVFNLIADLMYAVADPRIRY